MTEEGWMMEYLKQYFYYFYATWEGKEKRKRERECVRESCVSSSLVLEPERVDYLVEFIYGSTKTKTTFYWNKFWKIPFWSQECMNFPSV